MIKLLTTLLFFTNCLIAKDILYFTPLPTKSKTNTINDFLPLTSYLQEKLDIKIEYVLKKNYKDILESFTQGKIDLVYLGPLPYIALNTKYKDNYPLVTFIEKDKKHKYKCVLAKFSDDKIDFSKKLKIALTQPLSTCGYFMSSKLLKKDFDIDILDNYYNYEMSHENALLSVVEGRYDIAGARDEIAKRHTSLGIEIISESINLPGFTLVGNRNTVKMNIIKKIQNTLLNTSKKDLAVFKKGKFGFKKANKNDFFGLNIMIENIPHEGNLNEK